MSDTKTEVLDHLKKVLIDLFELEEEQLTPDAKLYDDLDIDSIDTIDLLIELKKYVGKEISVEAFVDVETIGDVAEIIATMK